MTAVPLSSGSFVGQVPAAPRALRRPAQVLARSSQATARLSQTTARSSQATARSSQTTEFRLTVRGRRALAGAGVALLIALTGWGSIALADQPVEPMQTATYTFLPGESLWQVASAAAAPGQDVREVLDQIMELNGMTTSAVQAGDMIRVPVNG